MNFTKDELKWIAQSQPKFDDMLTELNQRTRAYLGFQGRTVQQSQEQALIDFQNLIKPGQFIATTSQRDFDNWIYFKVAK